MKVRVSKPLTRRKALAVLGGAAAAVFLRDDRAKLPSRVYAATLPSCVVRPEQTEGPYFVDEKLNRSDIRVEPSDNSAKAGVPLTLEFQISRIAGGVCAPLSAAVVDIWHCDALGVYSSVRDRSFDTGGKKFLRGYQITGANGVARFVTIFPGWYEGRTVHIHFKIRAEGAARRSFEFTSQLYFDESVIEEIHNSAPYDSKGRRRTTNRDDFIFRRGGNQLLLKLTRENQSYAAKFDIGLQIA
jgi:protocatechuate 3,4-dioxygenase beta subunit